ncbi:hypothetical protein VHP8226_02023 [Vibrio hippocampi]|uniref:Uncharacterized protein n=1 Tax=Vibrio hippocampi TaxID=654686 RepID=A0ABM8ZJA5_9VIBR|nr:hypothetical protein VHP8226_02023 [Vibrio hippocampi]
MSYSAFITGETSVKLLIPPAIGDQTLYMPLGIFFSSSLIPPNLARGGGSHTYALSVI